MARLGGRTRAQRRAGGTDPLVPIDPEKLWAAWQRAGCPPWRELAERAGTSHNRLSGIANQRHAGRRPRRGPRVHRSLRRRLARVLGVTTLWLEQPAQWSVRAELAQADYLEQVTRALARDTGIDAEVRPLNNADELVVVAEGEPGLETVLPEAWAEEWELFRELMNPRLWESVFNDGPAAAAWTDQEFEAAVLATIGALRAWLGPWLDGRAPLRRDAIAALAHLLRTATTAPAPAPETPRIRLAAEARTLTPVVAGG